MEKKEKKVSIFFFGFNLKKKRRGFSVLQTAKPRIAVQNNYPADCVPGVIHDESHKVIHTLEQIKLREEQLTTLVLHLWTPGQLVHNMG